jgi:protein TonB
MDRMNSLLIFKEIFSNLSTQIGNMEKYLYVFALVFSANSLFAQEDPVEVAPEPKVQYIGGVPVDPVVYFPDLEAEYPGGAAELQKFISTTIHYPEDALENDIHGKVYLSFTVEKDGFITDIKVERGVHELLDKESVRVVEAMPQWIPGEVGGKPVRTRCRLPIVYAI